MSESAIEHRRSDESVNEGVGPSFGTDEGESAGPPAHDESPSFLPVRSPGGAYEVKFVIDERRARDVIEWSGRHLWPDPHADGSLDGGAYLVNTLYLDTPRLDVFHRTRRLGPRKFRLRRYGAESTLWLELKQKRKGVVRKRRVAIAEQDLNRRLAEPAGAAWDGRWFRHRVDRHELRPVCRVTYRRIARVGQVAGETVRLTLDDEVRGQAANGWWVPDGPLRTPALLDGRRILELKYRGPMPSLFRGLVMDLGLTPGSFSKYREAAADAVPLSLLVPAAGRGTAEGVDA